MDYLKRSEELFEETVENRRHLHQTPELGLELPETTAFIMEKLTEIGYDPKPCGGGVVACVGKTGGKTVLLRGDVDALPMKEESGLPFASQRENAHTCGHDIHGAMLLTAAKMLKENEASLKGTVKLMFQPGEETFTGAKAMIADGVLENPKPDAALGYHVGSGSAPVGLFIYNRESTLQNSSDNFRIDIQGKGGHGASPNECIDPVNIAAHIILALESVIAREVKSTQASVLTIGKVVAGNAGNIIPDTAELYGTLRCDSKEEREFLLRRLDEVVEMTAKTYRGSAKVTIVAGTPPLICDPQMVDDFVSYMKELDVPGQCEHAGMHAASSEDFSAAGFTDGRETYNQHHPKVEFNEEVMKSGAAYLAHCATRWLEEHK